MNSGKLSALAAAILALALFGWANATKAQGYLSATGSPTFSVSQPVELGFADIANGNLHLEIPIGVFPQRGAQKFSAMLVYDSRIWQPVNGGSSQVWQPTNVPNSWGGWRFVSSASTGNLKITGSTTISKKGGVTCYFTHYNFAWVDPYGTSRPFPIQTSLSSPSGCGGSLSTASGYATDSTGFFISVTNFTSATVFAPDGTQVYPTREDSNGNYFSADSNGNIIDTLGRTPITKSVNGNVTTYSVLTSQGGTSNFAVTTETIAVSTNFGESGITEYSGNITVVQSISLPDGKSYQFTYDSGSTAGHYGETTGMTLPTGGQVTYGYSLFTDPFGNVNHWLSSRTSGGGTWNYTMILPSPPCATQCFQIAKVGKPSGDTVAFTFELNGGGWNTQTDAYTGSGNGGANLLEEVDVDYDFSQTCGICSGPAYVRPIHRTATFPSSLTKRSEYTYDSPQTGNVTVIKEWKSYNFNSPGNPDRETDISYLATSAYTAKNIINRPLTITVCPGSQSGCTTSNGALAQTTFSYDGGTLSSVTGITHHDDTNFGTGSTVRGNVTQIQRWAGSSNLTTTISYDTTGQTTQATDPNNNSTSFSFADNFYTDNGANPPQSYTAPAPTNAYMTKVTLPLIGSATFGYYYNTGKRALSVDQNGADAYVHFLDSLDRLTNTYGPIAPSGSRPWTLLTYAASETQGDTYAGITDTAPSAGCSSCTHVQAVLDNLGRVTTESLVNDPDGATNVVPQYDTNGRILSVSHPYRSTSDATYGLETPSYDGMDRVTKVTHQDGSYSQTFYGTAVTGGGGIGSQLCSTTMYGLGYPVLGLDEAGKKRQTWTDGFGRLIEVDEPDNSGNLTLNTCYTYNLGNELTQVAQGSQTRSYSYDPLWRVTSLSTPESGTTNFSYTVTGGGLCSGNPSLPCSRTDARGSTTTYTYDALNRLTKKTYSDTTATVQYGYDGVAPTGCATAPPTLTDSNPKRRRTSMCDGSGATSWSHDLAGHILTEKRTILNFTNTITYGYNLDGSLASVTYPSGRTITYQEGNAGRALSAKDATNNINYAAAASYAPMGAVSSVIYGQVSGGFGGITKTDAFNNRLEYTSTQASSTAGTAANLSLCYGTYSFSSGCTSPSTNNNGSVTGITNNANSGLSESYSYDPLNRVLSGATNSTTATGCWGQSFGPSGSPPPGPPDDRFSNLSQINVTQCASGSLNVTADQTTNRINTSGYQYDAAGNMTNDTAYTYTYDAENRIVQASGMSGGPYCYVYDGNGLRVAKKSNASICSAGTITMIYWRAISGETITETNSSGATLNEYMFFARRRIARRDSSGNVFYYYADQLGSTVAMTDGSGNACYQAEFTPYGQEIATKNTCSQNYKFAGYERDTETGLDYAFARYYNSRLGRFMSADPLAGNVGAPQSLNRYAYVGNNPVNLIDPLGLECRKPMIATGCNHGGVSGFDSCMAVTVDGFGGCLATYGDAFEFDVIQLLMAAENLVFNPVSNMGGCVDCNFNHFAGIYDTPFGEFQVQVSDVGILGDITTGVITVQQVFSAYVAIPPYRPSASNFSAGAVKKPSKKECNPGGVNASGSLFGYPATQTVSATVGLANVSSNGDVSASTPGLGVSVDNSINAPEDVGVPGLPAAQVSLSLGKFVSVGTYFTMNGPQGFVFSYGYGFGLPISVSVPVYNVCGGSAIK